MLVSLQLAKLANVKILTTKLSRKIANAQHKRAHILKKNEKTDHFPINFLQV
jgi:hypothetical protein